MIYRITMKNSQNDMIYLILEQRSLPNKRNIELHKVFTARGEFYLASNINRKLSRLKAL